MRALHCVACDFALDIESESEYEDLCPECAHLVGLATDGEEEFIFEEPYGLLEDWERWEGEDDDEY